MKLAISISALCLGTSIALAHNGATGIIKDRMDRMADIAKQMKTVGGMLSGKVEMNPEAAATALERIAAHSDPLRDSFPEGSNSPPSEAAPAIWVEQNRFMQLLTDLENASIKAAQTAQSGDLPALKQDFRALAGTCKACHQTYRLNLD